MPFAVSRSIQRAFPSASARRTRPESGGPGPAPAAGQIERVSADQQTGKEARRLPRARGHDCFVEVIEIEVLEAVVALISAEIFEVQIAANPRQRGRIQRVWRGQSS